VSIIRSTLTQVGGLGSDSRPTLTGCGAGRPCLFPRAVVASSVRNWIFDVALGWKSRVPAVDLHVSSVSQPIPSAVTESTAREVQEQMSS
jgi:hypothetical protein